MNEADYLDRLRAKIRLPVVRNEITNADIEYLMLRAKHRESAEWTPEDEVEQEGIGDRLSRLTPIQMEIVKMRYFGKEIVPFRQIAKTLGLSHITVWKHHRAAIRSMKG